MGFLAPMMLLGAVAAVIPVALHLIQRSRPVVVPWAAMEFLLKSIKETQAASRLRDLLLLVCRVAVVVLAALALARPTSSFVPPTGPVEAVYLFDVSRSMSTIEGTDASKTTRLEIARARLRELLDALPSGSRASVIPFADRVIPTMAGPLSRDPSTARDGISRLVGTDLGTRLGPAWEEAVSRVRSATLPQTQIQIISDAGVSSWREAGESLRGADSRLPESTRIQWIRVGTPVSGHVQLIQAQPDSGLVFAGRRQGWRVRMKNPSNSAVRNIQVAFGEARGNNAEEATPIDLNPGEERVVSIEALLEKPGPQPVEIATTFPGSRLPADGKTTQIIHARDRYHVLLVDEPSAADPTRGGGYFLAHALRSLAGENTVAETRGVLVETRQANQLGSGLLAGIDAVYLCGVNPTHLPTSFARELEEWCGGGRVAYLMGSSGGAPSGSAKGVMGAFAQFQKPLPTLATNKPAIDLHPDPATAKSWLEPFSRPPLDRLGRITLNKPWQIEESRPDAKPGIGEILLRSSDGKPLVMTLPQGEGEWVLSAMGMDTADGDLPLGPVFVPLVGAFVGHAEERTSSGKNLRAGENLTVGQTDKISNKESKTLLWRGPGDATLSASQPVPVYQAGLWRLEEGGIPVMGALAAVSADPSEGSDLDPASAELVREIVGPGISVSDAGSTLESAASAGIDPGEMAAWLLPVVLALLLFEGFVAWWAGRPL